MSRAGAKAAGALSRARTPRLWTPALVAAVCARHAKGTPLSHACALEGASRAGLHDARLADPEIEQAVAHAHATWSEELRRLKASSLPGADDWKKWSWDLERWDRVEFAPPTQKLDAKQDLTSAGAPLVVSIETARELARRGRP